MSGHHVLLDTISSRIRKEVGKDFKFRWDQESDGQWTPKLDFTDPRWAKAYGIMYDEVALFIVECDGSLKDFIYKVDKELNSYTEKGKKKK